MNGTTRERLMSVGSLDFTIMYQVLNVSIKEVKLKLEKLQTKNNVLQQNIDIEYQKQDFYALIKQQKDELDEFIIEIKCQINAMEKCTKGIDGKNKLQRLKSEYLKEINRNKVINRAILSKSSFHSEKHSISRSESSDNDGEDSPNLASKYIKQQSMPAPNNMFKSNAKSIIQQQTFAEYRPESIEDKLIQKENANEAVKEPEQIVGGDYTRNNLEPNTIIINCTNEETDKTIFEDLPELQVEQYEEDGNNAKYVLFLLITLVMAVGVVGYLYWKHLL